MAKHIGSSGRIHAFEPTPDSYRLLLRNIDANDLAERARATNALISDAKVEYAVHYSSDHSSAAYFVPTGEAESDEGGPGAEAVEVATLNLDAWGLEGETALDGLDILKVDTEGMELRVLRSASALIERFHPIIMAEICNDHLARAGDSSKDVARYLKKRGYKFYRNKGPRHARSEDFELVRIWSPAHVSGLYDLIAIHDSSERQPRGVRSPLPGLVRYWLTSLLQLPARIMRRILG